MKTNTIIGLAALAAAAGLGYMAFRKSGYAGVFMQSLSGFRALQAEQEKARARAFLTAATGQGTNDRLVNEVINQSSGLASGKSASFREVLVRGAIEGHASPAVYGTLGVPL